MNCPGCGREAKQLVSHHWCNKVKEICTSCNVALGYQFGPDEFGYPSWEKQLEFLRNRLKQFPDLKFPYNPKSTIEQVEPLLLLGFNQSQIARRLGISPQRVSFVILEYRKNKLPGEPGKPRPRYN